MKNWINRLLKSTRAPGGAPEEHAGPDPVHVKVDELERAVARLAREQAKTNVELEASNRTQERLADDLNRALHRLEEALQRRYQAEASAREEGFRQGRQEVLSDAVHGIIAVLDGLGSAIGFAREAGADAAWLSGLEAVMQRGDEVLARWGIEPTSAPGLPFDPEVHEAVGVMAGGPAGRPMIGQEVLRGYRLGDQVFRIAKVVVIRSEQDDRDRSGHDELGNSGDRVGWQAPGT